MIEHGGVGCFAAHLAAFEGRKNLFFEKKKQKTFAPLPPSTQALFPKLLRGAHRQTP
jgi:hypothetical protein